VRIPGRLWPQVVSFENLLLAAKVTLAHGRRYHGEGAAHRMRLEERLLALQRELSQQTYRHGRYRGFTVYEPKQRLILAAPVRDRIVHHALHDVIAPYFDRGFIFDSYACRPNKGAHRALDRAQKFLQANRFSLHLDVRKFFPSLPHAPLKEILRRSIREREVLWLFDHIIDSSLAAQKINEPAQRGLFDHNVIERGLPIGNLTSQFLANLYLNELDQFVKHTLRCRHYIRYMDDLVLFGDDRGRVEGWRRAVHDMVNKRLLLSLHEKGGIKEYREGLSFLGFRVFRKHRLLKGVALTRFLRRARIQWRELEAEQLPDRAAERLASITVGTRAWLAHIRYGDTHNLALHLRKLYPMLSVG
jgi:RNA-directed DNA polymerase